MKNHKINANLIISGLTGYLEIGFIVKLGDYKICTTDYRYVVHNKNKHQSIIRHNEVVRLGLDASQKKT